MARLKLKTILVFLSATALAGVLVTSVSALATPGGIPGPNPDAPGQIKKANGPTVSTTDGPVRGFVENGVNKFLGIPYAAPPVGDLRWKPPAPPAHHDLLDATQYANTCPQVTTLGPFAGPTSITEDCLYLNVFTTGTSPAKPVIVWIHGGANLDGESNDYDGSKLATGGPNGTPTVVVTINYRLGLFGILSETHLNSEGHPWGDYGILDQQAVLRWVQANIAAFGGDPHNVTLGGQSAGAYDTSANLISPGAAGLFQRAIIQSFPPSTWQTATAALQRGNAFAAAAGCSDAACLRKLSAERILQLQGTPNTNNGSYLANIFVDGSIIPVQPDAAWGSGAYNKMPIMGGSVKDEGNFNLAITEYFSSPQAATTVDQYNNNSTAVKNEYPLSAYNNNPQLAQNRISTDRGKCQYLNSFKLMASTNTFPLYTYDFTYQNAPYYFPQMPNVSNTAGPSPGHFLPLAAHTIDIPFLFPGYHGGQLGVNLDQVSGQPRELQGSEIGLSDQLVAAWTNFAKTGNPNGTGVPVWPVFTTGSPTFLQQDIPNGTETEAQYRANYHCTFWGL
jgi:para-nitrobenzyl esterase